MGKRGPKKKLATLEALEGNPGKRGRKPAVLTVAATGKPFVPDHLSEDATAMAELIIEHMPDSVYAKVDGALIAVYADAYAWHKAAVHEMNHPDFKSLVVGASGQLVPNPWFRVKEQQARMMMSAGDRLGLDPKSRQAIQMLDPNEGEKKSKFDGLIGREGGSPSKRIN